MSKLSLEKIQLTSQQLKDHYVYHNKKMPEEKKVETIRDEEMDDIINKLESNDSSLIKLRISNKNIALETLKRIASSLASNTVLTNLFLLDSPLCSEIEINTTLKFLTISGNPITAQGGICIAKSLEKNSTLRDIYFTSNFGDSIAKVFISVLATNGALQYLGVHASANLLLEIEELCVRNKSLCEHYEKVMPKITNYSLGFFCNISRALGNIVTEYCEGEYPRYSFQ